MSEFDRRAFLRIAAAGAAAVASSASGMSNAATSKSSAHVVVVGGGFGGATCAKYLKLADPSITVTLIEPARQFITCPFSNYVVAGWRTMQTITQTYDALRKKYGVQIVHESVRKVDTKKKRLAVKSGRWISYDRLVMAPGVELLWGDIRGYTDVAAASMPHAWKAGAQTMLLRTKLRAMKNGGTFIIVAPPNPFRCPPGPYERASVVAHFFKQHKPKSKILILDAKDAFSKQALFMEGWQNLYGDMIEWIPAAKGGTAKSVNTRKMTVETEFDTFKGDVVNVIPAQVASRIARLAQLVDDKGWCPVNPLTFESAKQKGVYVIGDAAIAGAMPKSGFAANSQGKVAASAIVASLREQPVPESIYVNTCYSLLAPDYGISVAGVYRPTADGIKETPNAGGVSPKDADKDARANEAKYALGWYASIVADTWA
jgi:sulfide dehydrogenase [flavocytochrome c] flavoprotein subunit